jgi:photosystem II stability/assembly factor-like uncharacterized protein
MVSRELGCLMRETQFVSPQIGYMGGGAPIDGGTYMAAIAKTTDGGKTWSTSVIPATKNRVDSIHFWSEKMAWSFCRVVRLSGRRTEAPHGPAQRARRPGAAITPPVRGRSSSALTRTEGRRATPSMGVETFRQGRWVCRQLSTTSHFPTRATAISLANTAWSTVTESFRRRTPVRE